MINVLSCYMLESFVMRQELADVGAFWEDSLASRLQQDGMLAKDDTTGKR